MQTDRDDPPRCDCPTGPTWGDAAKFGVAWCVGTALAEPIGELVWIALGRMLLRAWLFDY